MPARLWLKPHSSPVPTQLAPHRVRFCSHPVPMAQEDAGPRLSEGLMPPSFGDAEQPAGLRPSRQKLGHELPYTKGKHVK